MVRRRNNKRTITDTVKAVRRLNNSSDGNPRFQFFFEDHRRRRTMTDNMVGHFIAGVEQDFVGKKVNVHLERSNGHEYIVGVVEAS